MKKHTLLLIVTTILLAAGLSSCNLGEPECLVMPAPIPVSPGSTPENTWLAPGTLLTFRWLYTSSCMPDEYRIIVSRIKASPFDLDLGHLAVLDERVTTAPPATIIYEDGTTVYTAGWDSGVTLPVGIYYWRVIPYSRGYSGERSDWKAFKVWNVCSSHTQYTLPPQLIYPRYGQSVATRTPGFYWLDDNTCSLPGNFQVQISEYTYFPEDGLIESRLSAWNHWQSPGLQYCTRYYWRVRVEFADGTPGPVSETYYFDTASADGGLCTTGTSGPSVPTPAASSAYATPFEPANCRSGPTLDYPILSILSLDGQYEIRGRNQESNSWLVFDPAINNTCWVASDLVEVTGDTSEVGIAVPEELPPPLTEEPVIVDCSQWSGDQQACIANPACTWQPNLNPTSPCVNK